MTTSSTLDIVIAIIGWASTSVAVLGTFILLVRRAKAALRREREERRASYRGTRELYPNTTSPDCFNNPPFKHTTNTKHNGHN